MNIKISFSSGSLGISISSSPVGVTSNSEKNDFYVYEWFIKETGEVFYVGKGRGNRYKAYHDRAYMAEKIRSSFETGIRFVGEKLTEEAAINLEDAEMTRILNETNDRLTNRFTPIFANRDNGYGRSKDTPLLEFEKAPVLYTSEIENHYFGTKWKPFDTPNIDKLRGAVFIDMGIQDDVLETVFGGNLEKYRSETVALLKAEGTKILKSKFAKSVTSWIFIGDDYLENVEIDQDKALKQLNRRIPAYHLIDVWEFLKNNFGNAQIIANDAIEIQPINDRVPLSQILQVDFSKGFDNGFPLWEKAEILRKDGQYEEAIMCLNEARYQGYDAPVLYDSFAKIYRKLKDYDNEIDILREAVNRYRENESSSAIKFVGFQDRLAEAIKLWLKSQNRR